MVSIKEFLRPSFNSEDLNNYYDLETVRDDVAWERIITKVCAVGSIISSMLSDLETRSLGLNI